MRKGIETTFSMLKGLFLRKIHAVTFKGFLPDFFLNNLQKWPARGEPCKVLSFI
jgi:hypothetical protein